MTRIILTLLLLFLLASCDSEWEKNIRKIKSKYSVEEINSFYEVAFAEHRMNGFLSRWETEIYYFIEGDTLNGDGKIVKEIVKELNNLDLPVRIKEAKNKESANLVINSCLKENSSIESDFVPAITNVFFKDFHIFKCYMEIIKDHSNKKWIKLRKSIFLHEFGHVLGLLGHSTIRYNSFIYPSSTSFRMSEEDKKLLKILYDPLWPDKYSKQRFEEDFTEVLYAINAKEKLKRYIALNHIDKKILQKIYDFGFPTSGNSSKEATIQKYGNPLKIVTTGDLPSEWIKIIREAINEINAATPDIKIEYLGFKPEISYINGSVEFFFQHDPTMSKDTILSYTKTSNQSALYNVKDLYYIKFVYKEEYSKIEKILPSIIYSGLGISLPSHEEPFLLNEDRLNLKPEYKELLKVYYAPELPHNFKKSELEELIREYEEYYNQN